MQLIAGRDRRWWTVAVAVVLLGGVVAVLALAASAEPSSSPEAPTTTASPSAAASAPTPGAAPSSGPTGAPEPGSLEVVPAGEMRTRAPVPFDATGNFGSGLTLSVTQVEDVAGVAHGPGEIAGPAVRLSFALDNDGAEPISLETVVVAVTYGAAETPAVTLSGPGEQVFGGTLEPGATAEARYVFAIPVEARGRVRAVVSYTGTAPAVSFEGSVR
ncbi:hypothetical protein [Nocardioides caricicola]|uniref:DUF4352 domain-containing protein n=1 Tax=Nocardioides caricicola TaxID=634770 RepID=A0ABW0MX00_9ACTN